MLKILYAGSPDAAAKPLKEIAQSGKHRIVGVLTNPPSAQKRGKELIPTPVAQIAAEINSQDSGFYSTNPIQILTPNKLIEVYDTIKALNPDILVCFAYGKIFSQAFMEIFPKGGINLHPSLLPMYRGCAPVPAAILNCDKETGITIQRIVKEMDAGNILLQTKIPLTGKETSQSLLQTVSDAGGKLFLKVLDSIEDGSVSQHEIPQDSAKATYFGMMKKEDGIIDWQDSAVRIDAKIRAFVPWPGTFTTVGGTPLLIHESAVYGGEEQPEWTTAKPGTVLGVDKKEGILIKTKKGILVAKNLQWQTKKAVNWKDFINGSRTFIGSVCE